MENFIFCAVVTERKIHIYGNFYRAVFTSLCLIFSGIVWVDKPCDFDEVICFPNSGYYEHRKKSIFQLSSQREKLCLKF